MKKRIGVLILLSATALTTASFRVESGPKGAGLKLVVLDPGHGGKDPGTLGAVAKEKDLALQVALKVKNLLQQKSVKVELTRGDDAFVGLQERAELANQKKADLFVSIHCNSNPNKAACGSETYAMGVHKSDENFEVMKAENASILMEHNHKEKYDGFDPKSHDAYIIFKLHQHASLRQSLALAEKIETHIEKSSGRKSRGVKQAGFMVLWKTTMPSVLVETGFLSNANDEKFLNSKEGQQYVAAGICDGILEFHKTGQ